MRPEEIVSKLQDNGYEAFFVGGCVRDMILNIPYKDIDISTNATPDEIIKIFNDNKIKTFGKSFLVTLVDGYEISTFRIDKYNGFSDKDVEIKATKSAKEDAIRRDLTINSIFYDPITKKIIDYVNGQDDLQKRIIRFNGNPIDRIREDPNRIIRACRFLAKIDGDFDDETFEVLKTYSDYIETYVTKDRIRLEILKAMSIKNASLFFRELYNIGALKYIFPSLNNTYLEDGGPYHEEYVFDHCMMSGDHCSVKYPLIKLAAYLHDVGKSISKRINPKTNKVWFEGHEETGCDIIKIELEDLRFSNEEINLISNLILLHMRISHERTSPKGVRRTLTKLNDYNIPYRDLLRIAVCDKMGNYKSRKYYTIRNVYDLAKSFKEQVNSKNPVNQFSDLKINGYDVMSITGLKPGKEVGEVLKHLFDLTIDDPELNEKEKLIEIMKGLNNEEKNKV